MTPLALHPTALVCCVDELDAVQGSASDEDLVAADRLLDEVFGHF